MKLEDFKKGDRVVYCDPWYKAGDPDRGAPEYGIVSSTNEKFVFVKFYNEAGNLKRTAEAVKPSDLDFAKKIDEINASQGVRFFDDENPGFDPKVYE